MTKSENNPYVTELNGSINGKPHVIEMDVRRVLTDRAEREGRTVTDSELDEESQKLLDEIERMKAPKTIKPHELSIMGILSRRLKR